MCRGCSNSTHNTGRSEPWRCGELLDTPGGGGGGGEGKVGGQGDKINRSSVRLKWAQDCAPLSKMSGELAQPTPVAMATLRQFQPRSLDLMTPQ